MPMMGGGVSQSLDRRASFTSSYNATIQSRFYEAFLPVGEDIEFLLLVAVAVILAILIAALTKGRLGWTATATQDQRDFYGCVS